MLFNSESAIVRSGLAGGCILSVVTGCKCGSVSIVEGTTQDVYVSNLTLMVTAHQQDFRAVCMTFSSAMNSHLL